MQDRTIQPRIKDAVEFDIKLRPYQYFELKNGIPVYYLNAGSEEVMMVEAVFYAGNDFENQHQVASATNYLLKNGTTNKTAFQLNEHFDYYGAYLNRSCHNETASITLHCLTKYLGELLPVMHELINDSVFPETELEIYKQNSKQQLTVNLKKCDFVANRLIDSYLFGNDHPYGRYNTAEGYDNLTRDVLVKYFEEYYKNGKCIIFAAGVLPGDFELQLNNTFGQMTFNPKKGLIEHVVVPAVEKNYRVINDPEGVQGAIRVARPFPNRHHPDYKSAIVLNTILGGFFGSRLMDNIREDKGYTYGIHSFIPNHIQQTSWVISTEAGKDVCEATLIEIYKEIEILKNEPIEEDELLLVKNYMIGSCLGDIDGPFHIINRWKNLILHGLDENYFNDSINSIKNITSKELNALANKYLNKNDFYELIVF